MAEIENVERPYPRPLSGAKVGHLPSALLPARTALIGHYVTLEPLDATRHAGDLFEASHGSKAAGPLEIRSGVYDLFTSTDRAPRPDILCRSHRIRRQSMRPDKLSRYSARTRVIEIGSIWFGLTLQLRCAMDDLGYRRMQWRCNALNAASRAAARRLGFRFEGIFYNHMIFKGRNRDTAWYSTNGQRSVRSWNDGSHRRISIKTARPKLRWPR